MRFLSLLLAGTHAFLRAPNQWTHGRFMWASAKQLGYYPSTGQKWIEASCPFFCPCPCFWPIHNFLLQWQAFRWAPSSAPHCPHLSACLMCEASQSLSGFILSLTGLLFPFRRWSIGVVWLPSLSRPIKECFKGEIGNISSVGPGTINQCTHCQYSVQVSPVDKTVITTASFAWKPLDRVAFLCTCHAISPPLRQPWLPVDW